MGAIKFLVCVLTTTESRASYAPQWLLYIQMQRFCFCCVVVSPLLLLSLFVEVLCLVLFLRYS